MNVGLCSTRTSINTLDGGVRSETTRARSCELVSAERTSSGRRSRCCRRSASAVQPWRMCSFSKRIHHRFKRGSTVSCIGHDIVILIVQRVRLDHNSVMFFLYGMPIRRLCAFHNSPNFPGKLTSGRRRNTAATDSGLTFAVNPGEPAHLIQTHVPSLELFARRWCDNPADVVPL